MKNQKNKEIDVLPLFYDLLNSKARYVLFRGSTRSGKTIAIIQYLIYLIMNNKNLKIVIGVETLSTAKKTVVSDLEEWLYNFGIYDFMKINKSEQIYEYTTNSSTIMVVPADKASKWFGLKADIFWFNEATHIPYSIFEQAQMRLPDTNELNRIILDFNPTNPFSWVRELENSDVSGGVETYVSTYKDNPFLGDKQIKTIESWRDTNYNKWLVFAKGEYGEVEGAIYTNWCLCDAFPSEIEKYWIGLDFGFSNDPTAIVKVGLQGGELFLEELFYETRQTNRDISNFLKARNLQRVEVIADSAEPKSIEEIKRDGCRISPAKKGPDSIKNGIDILQRYKINIVKGSQNLIDEITNYIWKKNKVNGEFENVPVDEWNDILDAVRYVALIKLKVKSEGPSISFRTIRKR